MVESTKLLRGKDKLEAWRKSLPRRLKWRLPKVYDKYLGPSIGLVLLLAFLATLMWLWSSAGYREDEFGAKVVSSFSSFLIALVALWAGQGLKKHQEEAAYARSQLALNVELVIRILPHSDDVVVEVEVRVKNVSNKTWYLPLVYVFVYPVEVLEPTGPKSYAEVAEPQVWDLTGTNIARFSDTMSRLTPDEEEVLSRAYFIDKERALKSPYVAARVEVVGAPDSWEFDQDTRDNFDRFMDKDPENMGRTERMRPVRQTYMVLETTEKELRNNPASGFGKRVLIKPPGERRDKGKQQCGRIDKGSSRDYKGMLDKTVMWSRKRVICVGQVGSQELGGEKAR